MPTRDSAPPKWMTRRTPRPGQRPNTWGRGCAPCLSCESNKCNAYTPCLVPGVTDLMTGAGQRGAGSVSHLDAQRTPMQVGELAYHSVMEHNAELIDALVEDEALLGLPVGAAKRVRLANGETEPQAVFTAECRGNSTVWPGYKKSKRQIAGGRGYTGQPGWEMEPSLSWDSGHGWVEEATECTSTRRRIARARWGFLKEQRAALRATGPIYDGFWTRMTVVLVHAKFARKVGRSIPPESYLHPPVRPVLCLHHFSPCPPLPHPGRPLSGRRLPLALRPLPQRR